MATGILRSALNGSFTLPSLENIQKERRYELAFEGLRWNDMRRWGADFVKQALEGQVGAAVYNFGLPAFIAHFTQMDTAPVMMPPKDFSQYIKVKSTFLKDC